MRIIRIQHVSVSRPYGSSEQARAFYGDALGLTEIPVPESLHEFDLIWYQVGDDEIHLVGEQELDNRESARHFCLEVEDLAAVRARLEAHGIQTHDATPIPGRPRFFCADPFGNRIECTQFHSL